LIVKLSVKVFDLGVKAV